MGLLRRSLVTLVLPFLVACLSTSGAFAQPFAATGSLNTARFAHTATTLQDGRVLIAGGLSASAEQPQEQTTKSAELYDPSSGTSSATADLLAPRTRHTATLLSDGRVLIAGGVSITGGQGTVLASAEIYTPSTGQFTVTGSLNRARQYHTATLLQDGTVLIAGGLDNNNNVSYEAEIYNPSTGEFTKIADLKKDRYDHTATLLGNGKVLIAGGSDSASPLTSAELYDPSSQTFSLTGALITARALHTATLLSNGSVLIAGGSSHTGFLQSAELYDPSSGAFATTGSLTDQRSEHTATKLLTDEVLLAGGFDSNGLAAAGDVYDPTTGSFTATPPFLTPRAVHTAALLSSGQVLLSGGQVSGSCCSASQETYSYAMESGSINPKYIVVAVAYAPPGANSSVTYQQSTQFGTSSSLDQTFTNETSVSVSQSVGITIKGGDGSSSGGTTTTASTTYSQAAENGSTIAVNKTQQLTQGIHGPASSAVAVDHDDDEVYVWANPRVNLTIPADPNAVIWNGYSFDDRDPINDVDVQPISVKCLKDFNSTDQSCIDAGRRLARSWDTSGLGGLTADDYQTILARDPFATNPSYDPTVPEADGKMRFQRQMGVNLDYTPAPQGGQPAPSGYAITTTTTTTSNQSKTDSYKVGLSIDQTSGSSFIFDISNKLSISNTSTWVNKWSQTNTAVQGQGIQVSITPPASSDNYNGPTAVEVWQDNVYGTLMFYMDPGSVVQPPGDFSITATPNMITAPQGQQSDEVQIGVTGVNGFAGNVSYTVTGLPTGVTAIPPSSTLESGWTEPMVFVVAADAPLGNSTVTITGTSGVLTHTATIALTIAPPPPPDFVALALSPASETITIGSIATVSVTATATTGYTGTINVSVQNLPTGVTMMPASASLVPGVPQTFTLIAGGNAKPGDPTVTFFGQVNSVNGRSDLALNVVNPTNTGLDVPTWHYDRGRTGLDAQETSLTPTSVTSASFGKHSVLPMDGAVDAQPLFLSGLTIGAQTYNVLYVATENDSVYALDANSGTQLWETSALQASETAADNQGCSELSSQVGITSTPVIDRYFAPDGAIYFVAKTKDNSGGYHQRLHALDLTTGAELSGSPVEITATYPASGGTTNTFDPSIFVERAALLLSNGTVYLSWGAPCQQTSFNYDGWVMAYSEATFTQQSALDLTPNGNGGGIWMSGAGPAADADGNVFLITSEGTFDTTLDGNGYPVNSDYGNGYVKIQNTNGVMSVFDYFEPLNGVQASATNYQDQGSGGVLLVPDIGNGNVLSLSVGAGKDGNIYYMGRTGDFLGEYDGSSDNNIYTITNALPNGASSTPAYFNQTLFYGGIGDSVKAIDVLGTNTTSQSANTLGPAGATPVISANGTSTAVAWALDTTASGGPVLYAYDATDLTHELYDSTQAQVGELPRDTIGKTSKHAVPVVANGFVYIGTDAGLAIFGLLP
jgi:Galactose oxidase, central domain/Kelch motif